MFELKNFIYKHFNNTIIFPFWTIFNGHDKELLYENKQYKNIHSGKRCFILGNGPSLKKVDFMDLSNEYVFTVNKFARSENASCVKSNYHFWADSNFFKDDNTAETREVIDTMTNIAIDNADVVSFYPLSQREFVESHGIDKKIKVAYYSSPYRLEDHMNDEVDYSKLTFCFGTVVQWCITMAIYMGFSEIYLLGCDNTFIMTIIKSALRQNDESDYGYKISSVEKKRMEKLLDDNSLEQYVSIYLNNLKEYRLLFEYCTKRNIKLINCSAETVIDSIPRMSLADVLQNGGNKV